MKTVDTLYRDLVSRKTIIDKKWAGVENAKDFEDRLFSEDPDCIRAEEPLSDTDLYPSLVGDIQDRIRWD